MSPRYLMVGLLAALAVVLLLALRPARRWRKAATPSSNCPAIPRWAT